MGNSIANCQTTCCGSENQEVNMNAPTLKDLSTPANNKILLDKMKKHTGNIIKL